MSPVIKDVEDYCSDKNVIDYEELGGLKIAYILGEKSAIPQGSNLQVSALSEFTKTVCQINRERRYLI